ncbi:MAG: histidine triad nucleotide-binding protein [Anaerolineales bacterium]|jgi:histidine triad (HIT) family protein
MNQDCIFCKIINGEIPSDQVFQDDQVVAFHDINPVAPTHILIVPKLHIASVNDLTTEHESLVGHMFVVASKLAEKQGITQDGYRLIINTGPHAGQVVFHLHLHLIGGQKMRYPMG